ncbi:MAG: alpha-2-macroglobulin family protein [Bacteroidales bacterium]|nr:alpha-2-macroglobulin family protein [Bacteroidales bacterium]MDY0215651.1 alpha-2-macroglobulin family protein [Bacteroidales bacterium]
MKKFFATLLSAMIFISVSGQSSQSYDQLWKEVTKALSEGLPKTASEKVNVIYEKAKLENNQGQLAKALIHQMSILTEYQEDYMVKTLERIDQEIQIAKEPYKQLLYSMKAQVLWMYYQNNRYLFMNRSVTVDFNNEDIRTWDLQKIVGEVFYCYRKSLENKTLLQKTDLKIFDPIITKPNLKARSFRPTLYDFIAYRSLEFFGGAEVEIVKPAETFYIDNPKFLSDANTFSNLKINSKDSLSIKFDAIKVYQDLLNFHMHDSDPTAFVDAELIRLKFVRQNAIFENVDSLYIAQLEKLYQTHKAHSAAAEIAYEMAEFYTEKAAKYNPFYNTEPQFEYVKALKYLDEIIEKYPITNAEKNAKRLKNQITKKEIQFSIEKVNIPGVPFRALITYRNVNEVNMRFLKMTKSDLESLSHRVTSDEFMRRLILKSFVKSLSISLPNQNDYQTHSVEISLPALELGEYLLFVSDGKNFDIETDAFAKSLFTISNLSYLTRSLTNGETEVAVYNSENGKVIEGAVVEAFEQVYDNKSRKYQKKLFSREKTNSEGISVFKAPTTRKYHQNLSFTISFGKDKLEPEDNVYQYYRDTSVTPYIQTSFFTDRAIYRPGQTVYFKGIIIEYKGTQSSIVPNQKTKVRFFDANQQEVATLDLVSNDFGSFSGSFTAPSGGLNGQMRIQNETGNAYFRVEEYKRPKFEVKFLPVTGSYRLNETLKVSGEAKAYAGNAIDGASVKYRITRRASYPWWRWWWGSMPGSAEMEISSGEMISDENGKFEIEFKAIPDFSTKKSTFPVFNYTVYADVTDINGETHSSSQMVSVGYISMYAHVSIQNQFNKNSKPQKYDIRTTNLNGQLDPAKISVKVYQLKQPDTFYRNRYWQRPDQFVMSESDFRAVFPNDLYLDEIEKMSWDKIKTVYDKIHNTATDTVLIFNDLKTWQAGDYLIEIKGVDNFGVEFSKSTLFEVADNESTQNSNINALTVIEPIGGFKPGETAEIIIGTKLKNAIILVEKERKGKIISKEWLTLNDEQRKLKIPVAKEDLDGFRCHITLVANNRVYLKLVYISVPDNSKQLDIAFETFRDKLSPGQQEEWRLKIKGENGDKVLAEILAGMYDASLDAFVKHFWSFYPLRRDQSMITWSMGETFNSTTSDFYFKNSKYLYRFYNVYEQLNWFGFNFYNYGYFGRQYSTNQINRKQTGGLVESISDEVYELEHDLDKGIDVTTVSGERSGGKSDGLAASRGGGEQQLRKELAEVQQGEIQAAVSGFDNIQVRTNFNETAFFMPHISTDEDGNAVLKFTVPESLTRWKIMGITHTKDLKFGSFNKELVTQKELMVFPNAPRFFREGDKISFSVKISNISDKDLSGFAKVEFFDAITMKPIHDLMNHQEVQKTFSTKQGQSTQVDWQVTIPQGIMAITYRVLASSGNFSDGEENTLPVLTNRMLVTESMPMPINGNQKKTFVFEKMQKNKSTTLKHFKYTLEFTSNPAWYAVQALPYLMEYPHQCSEQIFSRFYANSIATHIANSSPKIKAVFESWKNITPDALLSNLEKNQELRSLMLEETPWVLNAKSETDQKQKIGLLFDMIRMSNELTQSFDKLQKLQMSNGGWPWFKGMRDNRYITQHIITGFGHLKNISVVDFDKDKKMSQMVRDGMRYLDDRIREDYEDLKRYKVDLSKDNLGSYQIQYLYARSYFGNSFEISSKNKEAYHYYLNQSKKYWLNSNIYLQGMIALANHRLGDAKVAQAIMRSLEEKSLHSEEMGMYWASEGRAYYWYEAPIERQALFIEAFDEITKNDSLVEEMKIWLLKQKQTQHWTNTKATVEAIYALLLRGTDLLADDKLAEVKVGNQVIDPKKLDGTSVEAGTGYFKTSWSAGEINADMAKLEVNKTTSGVAWGAVYWQYFENLDKITPSETPLKLKKELFVLEQSDRGPVIRPISSGTKIKLGDKIKVRMEIRVDRDLEYVHIKDMRAAGFEPVNVLSQYKYQDGLGYYESTRDAATNFFIDYLKKGTYVFEYELVANQKGNFSNGITSIQCMYAPEFTSHSEGIRVVIE